MFDFFAVYSTEAVEVELNDHGIDDDLIIVDVHEIVDDNSHQYSSDLSVD